MSVAVVCMRALRRYSRSATTLCFRFTTRLEGESHDRYTQQKPLAPSEEH
jgi:hypothetical protein